MLYSIIRNYIITFDKDVVLWQKYKGLQEIDSQEEKFLKFVNKKIQSPEKKKKNTRYF
jgi:hypothetical protein